MPEKSNRRTVMEHFNPILGYETTGPKFITCGEIMLRLTPPNYEKLRMATNFEAS
jgi:2-dehydro-3-deoxygluconokinase